jgi:hypothetical protein
MKYATADATINSIIVNKNAMNTIVIRSHHVENEGVGGGANTTFEETGA